MNHLLWQRVGAHAERSPEREAVRGDRHSLTYGQLWEMSGRVAAELHSAGIGRGSRVGILLPKSPECVVAMLGASRAGATYVPVDPRAPASRQAYVLANAAVRAVIGAPQLLEPIGPHRGGAWTPERLLLHGSGASPGWMPSGKTVRIDELPTRDAVADGSGAHEGDPAYILYTSGSTGSPKGVVISHRNAVTFVEWGIESFGITGGDLLSNHAPHHFDLSTFDIFCALHAGACVAIVPDRLAAFPTRLADWIEQQGITVWYSVPSALVRLLQQGKLERFDFGKLRSILFAGEPFPVKYLREVMDCFPQANFHNLFGPTETNVCTWYSVPRPLPLDVTEVSIGSVCANMSGVVQKDDGSAANAVGEEGELIIGGPGVMLGYWGLPERTAAVRVQNPLHDDYADPMHRTGDRVRIRPDGHFDFLGRRDHMVKTRGYRVELGEVENGLLAHSAVRMAGVVALPDEKVGNKLYAAVAPEEGQSVSHEMLIPFLLERLARYAVPERIFVLDELPVTSTGKLDRSGLREQIETALTSH